MSKTILYQNTKNKKIQQWTIWVEESSPPKVWTEHGQTKGKKQLTHDVISSGVNIGKSNETTPLQQANLTMERKITKQLEKGYRADVNDLVSGGFVMNWEERLPKATCFYKPKSNISDKKIKELEKKGRAVYSIKRDGMAYICRKTNKFGIEIYSRRMELETDKFPHLIETLDLSMPTNSILLGEMCLDNYSNHVKAFKAVSSICRSDAVKSLEKQKELGTISYYIYDVAFWSSVNLLTSKSYINRQAQFIDYSYQAVSFQSIDYTYLQMVEIIDKPHNEALKEAVRRKLEGLVVWDRDGIMDQKNAITLTGKPERPNVLWKSKVRFELDAIARFDPDNGIGEWGTGKNKNKLKSVFLYQLDDKGNEIFISKCGGGFKDDEREFLTTADYPRVFRVLFDSIQDGTGSLRFPVFDADRNDKAVDECFMDEDIKQARNS